VRAVV